MNYSATYIIEATEQIARQFYREPGTDDQFRLAYQVGMLNGKIRELCQLLNNSNDRIKELENEISYANGH
jgi:hypothetical protein